MKLVFALLAAIFMVTPALAGEDPYIAVVGNDITANPFYFSPKYVQFLYDQTNPFFPPVCLGTFPPAYSVPQHPAYAAGCEQFRSQAPVIMPEVCDASGTVAGTFPNFVFTDRGDDTAVTTMGNAGVYEWYIRLPKKPSGEINLVLQCGVLKPNTFAGEFYNAVRVCAAETGERVGSGFCVRQPVAAGVNPIIPNALPTITAIAYPGPYNSFTSFNLTAFRNPGTYATANPLVNNGATQLLNGTDNGTRILLKSCMDKSVITKLPVAGTVNAAGQVEANLVAGDIIYVKVNIPVTNTVDVYCSPTSLRVMGIGESFF